MDNEERMEKVEQIAFNLFLQYGTKLPEEVSSFLKQVGFGLDITETKDYPLLVN